MKSYLSFDAAEQLKKSQDLPPHIHFIGIGGIGMSALAMILVKNGYSISGSDQKTSSILKELERNRIHVFQTQEKSNIDKINIPFVKEVLNFSGVELILISDNFLTVKNHNGSNTAPMNPYK